MDEGDERSSLDENRLTAARLAKVADLRDAGVEPYPYRFERDALAADLHERHRDLGPGAETGERLWPMPILPGHDEAIKGPYSDLRNSGGRWGGCCTAAAFLQNFVGDTPWAHLDIAGTAWNDRPRSYLRKGATGFGVRLLVEFLARRA